MDGGAFDLPAHPLAELFPLLPEKDVRELADDIVTFGLRVPIVLLDGKVLDGRNRLAACKFADVEPRFEDYDGDDPLNFVLSHNLHRRHLSESQRAMVAARIVDWENGLNQHSAGSANLPTRKAAEKLSISERAIFAARRIHKKGATELIEAIRDGRITVHAGEALSGLEHAAQREALALEERAIIARAKELRAARQRLGHARRIALAAEKAGGAAALPDKKYAVIYADPPWQFASHSDVTGREKSPENHYPTMPTEDIAALPCPAADTAVLFLWSLNAMLPEALAVMAAWGFAYKSNFCWNKVYPGKRHGTGFWSFSCHELLLIGTRGKFPAPLPGTQPRSVFTLPVGRHSEKPAAFAEVIERLYPTLPRIEMFCRTPRPGWDGWGNEVGFVEGEPAGHPSSTPSGGNGAGEAVPA